MGGPPASPVEEAPEEELAGARVQPIEPATGDAQRHDSRPFGDHLRDALLHVQRRRLRIQQQRDLAVGDAGRVFHRAGLEVRNADLIDLPVRIRLAEVILEKRHHRASYFLAERRQRLLLRHRPRAHGVGSRFPLRARGELADADRHQIAAEGRGLGELHGAAATGLLLVLDHGAVGESGDAVGKPDELQVPAGFEGGLIEAGKHATGVSRFELGHRQGTCAV